jgi:hypothetical protein
MTTVTNISSMHRRWDNLIDHLTGRTLSLAPGQSAETTVPDGFNSPHLSVDGVAVSPVTPPAPVAPPVVPVVQATPEADEESADEDPKE